MSPTILFSRQLSDQYCNSSNDVAYKSNITLTKASKTQQLPDLVKESNILKSKTAPNICNKSSIKDKEPINKQIFVHETKNLTKDALEDIKDSQNMENIFSNSLEENDFRPRSPLHETSIIVPQVDWRKKSKDKTASSDDSEIDSDSLSSSDCNEVVRNNQLVANFLQPRLQIHSIDGNLLLDEGTNQYKRYDLNDGQAFEPDSIEVSILRDRQLLDRCEPVVDSSVNNTHSVKVINNNIEQLDLRDNNKTSNYSSPISETSLISNKQDDSEENDITTAFTETEFSEWAHDGEVLVSDDFHDIELNIDPSFITVRNNAVLSSVKIANKDNTKFDNFKIDRVINQEYLSNSTSKLLANSEDINYMDTDNESLLDDSLQDSSNTMKLRNQGYIEFVNVKTALSDIPISINTSCDLSATDAPIVRLDLENNLHSEEEKEGFKDSNVIEIDPVTMEDVIDKLNESVNKLSTKLKIQTEIKKQGEEQSKEDIQQEQLIEACNKGLLQSIDEDSLLMMEPEDTTTSEIVTVLASPVNPQISVISLEMLDKHEKSTKTDSSNSNYLEYVKTLQSRITEFNNTKDTIDVKKSKRKNSKSVPQMHTTEIITEEIKGQETTTMNSNSTNSPMTSRKLEELTRERSKQKDLIQDLLMDKLEAHKQKSAEKKARRAARSSSFTTALSSMKPTSSNTFLIGNKFVPTSIISPTNSTIRTTFGEAKKSLDSSLPLHHECDKENKEKFSKRIDYSNQLQMNEHSTPTNREDVYKVPFMFSKLKSEETRKTTEKVKQDAKERARMKSEEDLSLSPEDRIKELKMKVIQRQLSMEKTKKDNALETEQTGLYKLNMMDISDLKLQTSKSTDNIKNIAKRIDFKTLSADNTKSMDELLHTAGFSLLDNNDVLVKRDKKKSKDSERRKSIIQAVSDFFFKKETSLSPNQKDKSMFRLTSKSKGKVSIIAIIIIFIIITILSNFLPKCF